MQTREDLINTCTIIIWVASALHAAVNFGQYPYAGYKPNRPTMNRRFMPKPGTTEYDELKTNPEKAFVKTKPGKAFLKIITPQIQSLLGISLIEILSRRTSDGIFLGQRDTPEWISDIEPLKAFERFGKRLAQIEQRITNDNNHPKFKNTVSPIKMPDNLLCPTSEFGLILAREYQTVSQSK